MAEDDETSRNASVPSLEEALEEFAVKAGRGTTAGFGRAIPATILDTQYAQLSSTTLSLLQKISEQTNQADKLDNLTDMSKSILDLIVLMDERGKEMEKRIVHEISDIVAEFNINFDKVFKEQKIFKDEVRTELNTFKEEIREDIGNFNKSLTDIDTKIGNRLDLFKRQMLESTENKITVKTESIEKKLDILINRGLN